ncbi:unnamed protein product [Adineta steineri]|uniref:Uncharacterized protein n=1 Tax=Adineta steineri TaxID=433720 RepID=A0A813QQ76_9BILA|nr:unnamed protein product [Adineta steineri]CAF0770181.1 unnamed protein product [Adineta steineri]
MDGISSITAIDQKMAEMRIKNLELLKRHQEIEEDRQLAEQSGAITSAVEYTKDTSITPIAMRNTTKQRGRHVATQQHSQESQHEQMHRTPIRRKFEHDRADLQSQRVQRVDYNRLKHERAHEVTNSCYNNNNTISPELLEYAYPFHYQSENNYDADEPAHAKKLVIVNNQESSGKHSSTTRIGSGRFNQQQQRTQEQGQRRREERMRRSGVHNNGHPGGPSEFHLDVPQIPIWQNNSIPPSLPLHVQLLPTNMNGHHTNVDHLMTNGGDQIDQSTYLHNFMYSPSTQSSSFNGNGTVYFTHPSSSMPNGPPSSQNSQTHFHQYHPTRTFENSNRQQFHNSTPFQSSPVFQSTTPLTAPPPSTTPSQLLTPSSSSSHLHQQQQQQENLSMDLPPRFRRLKKSDQDNKYSQSRPMSSDFEHLRNSSLRFNNDNRFQTRPQSFYDFASQQHQSNNNFFRSSNNNNNNNNNRYQRNTPNTNNLPLSAYMNTDDASYQNENINNNNYWGTSSSSYQRRRSTQQQRTYQDKHQFPLSSYDPRQYGFNNNNYQQRRNDFNNRPNSNRRNPNNNNNNKNHINDTNDIDLIEEWWEDDNTELISLNNQPKTNIDSQTTITTVNDSGNSSLSTSMHLKESTLDDEENNISINDFISPPSDTSTTDSNIIESLDQLQQQLKLEEAVEQQLASENDHIDGDFSALDKEPTIYDTAHFLQWAKEKFREELAGRLTAKEIQQHDAVTSDDDDDDDNNIVASTDIKLDNVHIDQTTDDDNENHVENMDELEDNLNQKLTIEENTNKSITVE